MNKITAHHLERAAYIYVRQSTKEQVRHNVESQRRQYDLRDRAVELGWASVVVIDKDQGHSGSGVEERLGFDELLTDVCECKVGAVFSIEGARLARNGREWHTLLEVCGVVGTLIIDLEGIYDPRQPNDRLLLGMKGSFSELELSVLRQRCQEALREKAARGELLTTVAVGYVRTPGDRLEKDPDRRVQEAIGLVFRKFRELGSARQVVIWMRQEGIELPVIVYGEQGRHTQWNLPAYQGVLKILGNPVYAGAYVRGRRRSEIVIKDGRKRVMHRRVSKEAEWEVLIEDHHEGYISWEQYRRNREILSENANMRGDMVRGAARRGSALLVGLLRCGHCGRKLHVGYSGGGSPAVRYGCRGGREHGMESNCISMGGQRAEDAVSRAVLEAVSPLGVEAALKGIAQVEEENREVRRQCELAVERARYEAQRAQRQYEAVEPENRLVAGELERRWEAALKELGQREAKLESVMTSEVSVTEEDRRSLFSLGADVAALWGQEGCPSEIKKRILRTVLKEIVTYSGERSVRLVLHWEGGEHTQLEIAKPGSGCPRQETDMETDSILREAARVMPDRGIAALLNRLGRRTARGLTWTESRVRATRSNHGIAGFRCGELAARGEMTVQEVADTVGVSRERVLRCIKQKILPARQACPGAPWIIRKADLDEKGVWVDLRSGGLRTKSPRADHPDQLSLELSTT